MYTGHHRFDGYPNGSIRLTRKKEGVCKKCKRAYYEEESVYDFSENTYCETCVDNMSNKDIMKLCKVKKRIA